MIGSTSQSAEKLQSESEKQLEEITQGGLREAGAHAGTDRGKSGYKRL
jgi:hypothetical protein